MNDLPYLAMIFAREAHKAQRRKYTNNPYTDHLAEVAGIVATVDNRPETIATAWLHDCRKDQGVTGDEIEVRFGVRVAVGVALLSDFETGNRAERKALIRLRLAKAPDWVQNIKCADLISKTSSIVEHDPKFAAVYLAEKRALLEVMTNADNRLLSLAWSQCSIPQPLLEMKTDSVGSGPTRRDNFVTIDNRLYIVWTQAGFKHAVNHLNRSQGCDRLPVEGFPRGYPCLVEFHAGYRGYHHWLAVCSPLNKAIDRTRSLLSTLETADAQHNAG